MNKKSNDPRRLRPLPLAYVIYTFVALFLFYEMALQVSPSIITKQLMQDLHIDAVSIGIISGVYFYSYMFMQIPSGLLFDHYPARWLIPIAILVCVTGSLFFATSDTTLQAMLGRFLMGIGSSFAFISVLVVSSRWFPLSYFAFLVGMAQLLAAAGAMSGEVPLAVIINSLGWRHALYWLIGIGTILAAIIWLILKNEPLHHLQTNATSEKNSSGIWHNLKMILQSTQSWWIALYAFCSWAPVATFASLWGVPYLMALYHISSTLAATACSMVWVGLMLGSPLFGWYSSKVGKRLPLLRGSALLGLLSSLIVVCLPDVPFGLMYLSLFGFGVATSGQILTFALVNENNPPTVVASAIGFNNMAIVAGGAIFQPLVGVLLNLNWHGKMVNEIPFYTINNYRLALCVVPLCFLVGWIISLRFIHETFCKPKYLPA